MLLAVLIFRTETGNVTNIMIPDNDTELNIRKL